MIGPNGAGKSTVFGLLSGDLPILKRTEAQICLHSAPISHLSIQARCALGLGRTYQSAAPFLTLSVLDNLQVASQASTRASPALLESVLEHSGLAPARHTAVADLAYPDWKRLDLALALVQAPTVLLLDEPTAGLAATERHAMMAWVQQLAREQGLGVLFTEHNLDAVFQYADTVLVLDRGSVLAQGSVGEIAANPAVQAAYTGGYTGGYTVKGV